MRVIKSYLWTMMLLCFDAMAHDEQIFPHLKPVAGWQIDTVSLHRQKRQDYFALNYPILLHSIQ